MSRITNFHTVQYLTKMDLLTYSPNIQNLTEIIRNRLYFAVVTPDVCLKNTVDTLFFNIDDEYVYMNYFYDFGPLNISCFYKYCCKVSEYLHSGLYKRIVHCTSSEPHAKANAAFLIGSFAVAYLRVNPRDITKALVSGCVHFTPFSDASQGSSDWKITLIDCFTAVQKAHGLGFFNFNDFDAEEYDTYDKLQNGDLNWLLPRKFLAFIGPTDLELVNYHSPDFYIQYFINNNVRAVVRLNNNTYNASVFTSVGIEHYDLFFPDGSTPPKNILTEFLALSEKTHGAVAVHCKAGLGRTGSLIAAYLIKHYRLTAREAIAWLRMCRPGSVIGQQQGWLEHMEAWLWRQGNCYRYENYGDCDRIPHHKYGIYSHQWKKERFKILTIAKQRELRNSSLNSNKTSKELNAIEHPFTSQKAGIPKPRNNKMLLNNCTNIFNKSPSGIANTTQGDKLNIIKAYKQHDSGLGLNSLSMHDSNVHGRYSYGGIRNKHHIGTTVKKYSDSNKKK